VFSEDWGCTELLKAAHFFIGEVKASENTKERPMAKAGDVIENPMTGERITFLKTTQETNGQLLRFEYVLPPGFTIPEHVHPHQEERHEVLSGTLRGRVGGQERDYAEGERVVGPAGVPHAWQNPGSEEELRFVSELRPPLVFETILETYCGLARDGKTTKQGIPKNPLQLAVLVDETRGMFYSSRVPVAVQEAFLAFFAVLASVGRLFGYRARYPEYSGSEEALEREDRRRAVVSEAMKGGVMAASALLTFVVLLLIWYRRR
jgi:quercetin dioxygenase-like cupin family protein